MLITFLVAAAKHLARSDLQGKRVFILFSGSQFERAQSNMIERRGRGRLHGHRKPRLGLYLLESQEAEAAVRKIDFKACPQGLLPSESCHLLKVMEPAHIAPWAVDQVCIYRARGACHP